MEVPFDPGVDFYAVLGINDDATMDEIEAAYRLLRTRFHPDRFPNADSFGKAAAEESFKRVEAAHHALIDRSRRNAYDASRTHYYDSLPAEPPALRFSAESIDFGTVSKQQDGTVEALLFFNDGGDATCDIMPTSGAFWRVTGEGADHPTAAGQMTFTVDIEPDLAPGRYQDEVMLILSNDTDVSAKRVRVRATLVAAPTPPKPSPPARTSPYTSFPSSPSPVTRAAVAGSRYGAPSYSSRSSFDGVLLLKALFFGIFLGWVYCCGAALVLWIVLSVIAGVNVTSKNPAVLVTFIVAYVGCYVGAVATIYSNG